jgi:DNA-binding protein
MIYFVLSVLVSQLLDISESVLAAEFGDICAHVSIAQVVRNFLIDVNGIAHVFINLLSHR